MTETTKSALASANEKAASNPYLAREILRNAMYETGSPVEVAVLRKAMNAIADAHRMGARWEGNADLPSLDVARMNGGAAPTLAVLHESYTPEERAAVERHTART